MGSFPDKRGDFLQRFNQRLAAVVGRSEPGRGGPGFEVGAGGGCAGLADYETPPKSMKPRHWRGLRAESGRKAAPVLESVCWEHLLIRPLNCVQYQIKQSFPREGGGRSGEFAEPALRPLSANPMQGNGPSSRLRYSHKTWIPAPGLLPAGAGSAGKRLAGVQFSHYSMAGSKNPVVPAYNHRGCALE